MVRQRGDPKVREYMKSHPEAVERVQSRCNELKRMPICDLCALSGLGEKLQERFITEVIKGETKE